MTSCVTLDLKSGNEYRMENAKRPMYCTLRPYSPVNAFTMQTCASHDAQLCPADSFPIFPPISYHMSTCEQNADSGV